MFRVFVGGLVLVNIERPKKGQVVQCSVVNMENDNRISFDKFIHFLNNSDCSFTIEKFSNELYGKWQVITTYKYNEDGFRSVKKEQIDMIYIDDSNEVC